MSVGGWKLCWPSWRTVFTKIAFYLVSFSGTDGDFQHSPGHSSMRFSLYVL